MGKFCLKSIETVHLRTIQLDSALHTHTEKEKRKKNTKNYEKIVSFNYHTSATTKPL